MRYPKSIALIFLLALLSFGVAACGDDGETAESTAGEPAGAATENVVKVQLGENPDGYFVKVDRNTVPAGTTTFVIDNVGTMHHEMAIFKTDLAPGELPLTDDGKVDEEKAGLVAEAVYARPVRGGEDHRIRDGRGVNFTIDLEPGKYVLLCNLPGHYAAGQYIGFTVN